MSPKTGGPAFPIPGEFLGEDRTTGMSLRDYFAAHAPREMWGWYAPTMPQPRPEPLYDHDHRNGSGCLTQWECIAVNRDELDAYDDERRKQWDVQWPYFYADAMLIERAKSEAEGVQIARGR